MRRLVPVLAALAGSAVLSAVVPAQAAVAAPGAARYYCGTKCTDKPPTYVIPGNGVVCSKSAKVVKTGHPGKFRDNGGGISGTTLSSVTVKVYYSTVCQTLWASIVTGPMQSHVCEFILYPVNSKGQETGNEIGGDVCPKPRRVLTTHMINDHSPTLGKAAHVEMFLELNGSRNSPFGQFDFSY